MAAVVLRIVRALPLLVISPLLMALGAAALLLTDALWFLAGRRRPPADAAPRHDAATVVIPNWNGRELLAKYLPSVVAALAGNPRNEIIVVENGSSDGSAEFLRREFPGVRLLALDRNLGFGGGSTAGFRAATNDVVVLLNSDMRVERDFLVPLLEPFADPAVFAVACQIFFSDPAKPREETGLTQGWWEDGALRVRHRIDPQVGEPFPCFYAGGGSSAFDRRKFLELGGFDGLLAPFYLEDTDLGYQAWKRGWKVLYQPRSVVWHEHRGTIARRFSEERIQAALKKNFILFTWKNMHAWRRLGASFFFTWAGAVLSVLFGDEPGRANLGGVWRAFLQAAGAARSRWRARSLAVVDDTEAFLRPLGGYYRDRFAAIEPDQARLRVLFVSPYPICPPIHGGGVFMYQTLREMARLAEVHVVELLDYAWQEKPNLELRTFCASAEWLVRMESRRRDFGSILPHAVREFANSDLEWLIHRQIYQRRIDVVQLEYTPLAQYAGRFRRIPTALFEHDVYFQSIARGIAYMRSPLDRATARVEYLRALRYELGALGRVDQVQVCSRENGDYLASFLPRVAPRIVPGLRAGIDTSSYEFRPTGRDARTLLFLGSFRHTPNQVALEWFIRDVLPLVLAAEPEVKVLVVGSDPPPQYAYGDQAGALVLLGFVEDIRELMARSTLFICPIRSGSGVRVKLLEAFAAGIPVVSTLVGAEGLATQDGEVCALADTPAGFAARVVDLLRYPEAAAEMARRARAHVVENWDMATITRKLVASYGALARAKRMAP
jgi:GT2 family glycosyltransferase/glycosyltransferase involved in cell wall biosynthesis